MMENYKLNTVVEMLHRVVETRRDVDAFVEADRRVTYEEFGSCVARLKRILSKNLVKNQRIAIVMPNSIELAVAIFAVWKADAQVALFNPSYPMAELSPLLKDAAPTVIIADSENVEELCDFATDESIVLLSFSRHGNGGSTQSDITLSDLNRSPLEVLDNTMPSPESLALLLYTGGTTGLSKGVIHSHASLMASTKNMHRCWPTDFDEVVWLSVAPMFHIWGLMFGFLNPIFSRATNVMVYPFRPELALQAMSDHKVTVFGGGPPAFYQALLASPAFIDNGYPHLKTCPGGGAAFPLELHTRWKVKTGQAISEALGMTEISPICGYRGKPSKLGSVGPVIPTMLLEIVDLEDKFVVLGRNQKGEIRVRGPNAMLGYRNRSEDTAETLIDGWIYTGDIGHLDEDDFLFVTDRKKDMVNVSGFKVFPRELDELLYQHPDIEEACTTGVQDPRTGEAVCVFAVPQKNVTLDKASILSYMESKVVKYKLPKYIFIVDSIAKTQANKPDRKTLKLQAESIINARGDH